MLPGDRVSPPGPIRAPGAIFSEGIRWHAAVRVEKFSEDQTAWARRHSGILAPDGSLIRRLTGRPEDGVTERAGNVLVTAGLNVITNLIIGGGDNPFSNTYAIVGVGASTANDAAVGDTALADDNSANAYYQQADDLYPAQANGVITCYATFATGVANYAWQEWCLAVAGSSTITAGDHLSAVSATAPTMLNHKMYASGDGLGTKSSGSWQLQATITLA